MMDLRFPSRVALAAVLGLAGPVAAQQILFGKKLLLTNPATGTANNRIVHVARDPGIVLGAGGGAGDPQCSGMGSGGSSSLEVTTSGGAGSFTIPLPCEGWTANRANTRYRYRDPSGATCQLVLVKSGAVAKAVCRGPQVAVTLNADMAPVVVVTRLNSAEYVTEFAGTVVADGSDGVRFLAKNAPPPNTTSSTTVSTSTSTSTSTTTGSCCGGAGFVSFTATNSPGDCGDALNFLTGAVVRDLSCGTLSVGSGVSYYPPIQLPDTGTSIFAITSCSGQTATLGPTTSAQTGSLRTCTDVGCLVGAPVPMLPVSSFPEITTCAVVSVAAPVTGSLDCSTGDLSLTTGLDFRIGDPTVAVVPRPCPRCSGGTCIGGPNDGLSCTPGTTALSASYPTSHDCPPDPTPAADVSFLFPTATITTNQVTWQGVPSPEVASGLSTQTRVFCGFCRDADDTGEFENPPHLCLENGMAVGTPCAGTFETCEQKDNGAFGPNGGAVKTITITGASPGASLNDLGAHPATLASVFCVAPSSSLVINAAFSLGGPGAFAAPGTLHLCSSASPCP